jgi:hypothetical protein
MPCRALVVVCALLIGCAPHQSAPQPGQPRQSEPPRRPLGRITIAPMADACPGSSCFAFTVESDDVAESASGRIIVSEPVGKLRGTVLSFSGGAGTSLSGNAQTMTAWSEAGFRVVRVQWNANWWAGASEAEGFAALASRPATVTNWVADHLVEDDHPLCVEGGSGGAGQVAYGLTHYGLEDKISLAVPWTGFWMGRIDLGCLDNDPRNAELHYSEAARRAIDLSYGVSRGEDGPCLRRDQGFRDAFAEASISVDADLHYPNTMVWHVLAGADEVGALGQGLTYYDAMLRAGSPHVRVDVLPGLRHGLSGPTDAGRMKIRDVILQECVVR